MTLYTALGNYEYRKDNYGEVVPFVIADGKEYELNLWEMICWSSLIWNIYTFTEISGIFYRKERDAHILGDQPCEYYLDSLESKGLIVVGHGDTGMDALHDLLTHLYVVPIHSGLFTKVSAFLHLTFCKGIPYKVTRHIFDRVPMDESEKMIWKLTNQNRLSVGELTKCVECGIVDVSTDEKLVDALYDDEDTTYKNIGDIFRSSDSHIPVLSAVSTLYLNRQILFER